MLSHATTAHWLTLHGLITLVAILFYVITSHATRQRRQPAAAIAWILFMVFLPYLALPAFLAFGLRKVRGSRSRSSERRSTSRANKSWAIETIMALGQSAPASYHDLTLHNNGAEARAALLDI